MWYLIGLLSFKDFNIQDFSYVNATLKGQGIEYFVVLLEYEFELDHGTDELLVVTETVGELIILPGS